MKPLPLSSRARNFDLNTLFSPRDGVDSEVQDSALPSLSSLYVHVPFCAKRCGYCDFNTYTKDFGPGASRDDYGVSVLTEARLADEFLGRLGVEPEPLKTVYFGGGTPTLLAPSQLRLIMQEIRRRWGIADGAEVSIEANPDTVSDALLELLVECGFNRVSLGMQSAVPSVLKTLDRTHRAERIPQVVEQIKQAGLQVSVDLIYGTPGESRRDWETSVQAALSCEPSHISAYSLVIEPGTKMGQQLAHGEISAIDPDEQADKYEYISGVLEAAGYHWYEISNWAKPLDNEQLGTDSCPDATYMQQVSRHNLAYWLDWSWWGLGPGAHSHLVGHRWWNLKHPRAYAELLRDDLLPIADGESVTGESRELERLMLGLRIARGLAVDSLPSGEVTSLISEGLLAPHTYFTDRVVLTERGRLLADHVTQRLLV